MSKLRFLYGPVSHRSSWVEAFGFAKYGEKMGVAVRYLDGFACIYDGTTIEDYQYLRKSRSKGKGIWKRFYHLEYTPIEI